MTNNNKSAAKRRATSYDVAKLAGVSQSAVSRVYKDNASVSSAMRKRVLEAAKELGYQPNAIARGLITQRSNMVGVIIPRMTNLSYPEVLVELTQAFSQHDIRVLLFTIERESDTTAALAQLLQYRVDGVVTAAMLTADQLTTLERANIPIVFYNRSPKDGSVPAVRCDQEEGERWLVKQLVEAGHRRIAIISGPADSTVSVERTQEAIAQLAKMGITEPHVVIGDHSYESGRQSCHKIMSAAPRPDAIIAANDMMAIGCIDEVREGYELRVPDDISIVGFDGISLSSFVAYQLTTVQQPVGRMTRAAVAMLIERIEDETISPEERVFAGLKVIGNSARLNLANT